MKALTIAVSILLGFAPAGGAAPQSALTTLKSIHALSKAQAGQGPSVVFYATIVYVQPGSGTSFVQEGNEGLQVREDAHLKLSPGDRVLIKGKAHASFRPVVIADSITVVGHGPLPKPVPATFDALNRSELDSMRVTVRAVVLNEDTKSYYHNPITLLHMQTEGGTIDAWVDGKDPDPQQDMFDDEIEVTGIASGKLDEKLHHIGVKLNVSSFADIGVLRRSASRPWSLPVTPIGSLFDSYRVTNETARIRVHGTITFYQPGSALVIQTGNDSLWITTNSEKPLRIGNQADVTGFAALINNHLALSSGEVLQSPVYTPIAPQPITWRELPNSKHIFDLVSVEGKVMMEVREQALDEYFLASNGQVFSAIYDHPYVEGSPTPPMKQIPLGSTVRVSGICFPLQRGISFSRDLPADILMRGPNDLAVIAGPSWLNVRNLMLMVGLLFALVVAVIAWGWTIERRARRQTAALATRIETEASLERRRSSILEDINGTRPLADILEQIVEMVSFILHGAPCWCQDADGVRVGNCPSDLQDRRLVRREMTARSGRVLGTIVAALEPSIKPCADESNYLSMAVELATAAIETRRMYSDLLHRSEFDLLTDMHNRFSLDKHLEACILNAGLQAGIFGLIYVDLDRFKLVNDDWGHHVGDLYLQEVAARMKQQLRSVDVLARVGGDEFAVLVPAMHGRVDIEEIALRLERCFDDPFFINEHILHGSASVGIAVYPEDAFTKEGLLKAADAAMYRAKNDKKQIANLLADGQNPLLVPKY
jgi:diguanylate cyclase (GGDEF)-like protein